MDSSRFGFVSWLVLACLLAGVLSAAIDPQNGVPESVESTEPTETAEPTVPVIEERAGYGFSQQSPYYPPHQPHQPNVPPHSPLVPNLLHSQIPTKQMEGNPSAFGPTGSAFHDVLEGPLEIPMEVLETNVDCQKSFMNIFFKLSRPFFGYIYPYGNFDKCVLFVGSGQTDIKLKMSHDLCGAPPSPKVPGYSLRINPVIEHRLMIQWDMDLVQEYDTNVLVRCDRPDDYNKTVKFDLTSVVGEQQSAVVKTHPGPQMWMEVQHGEGPRSKPLLGPVFLGDTLSLVFTLSDDVFRFDSNVLNCWATDGNNERKMITTYEGYQGAQGRPLMTQIPVIENTCSIKPKLFGHFQKVHEEFTNAMTTTQWVLFKAFRFPTSGRVLIQCDIQVCYDKCHPLAPCGLPFDPRSARSQLSRKRRETTPENAISPEVLTMFRAIEVFLPDDADVPITLFNGSTVARASLSTGDCLSTTTFYGVILGLGMALLILIVVTAGYIQRLKQQNSKT